MDLFGFSITRKKEEQEAESISPSFVPPTNEDGALVVQEGGVFGTYVDLDGTIRTEAELVTKYREIAQDPTVDQAVADIVNEAIIEDSDEDTVSINIDDIDTKDNIKESIRKEFKNILNLLEFNNYSYEIFKRWYVDGRLYYHVLINEKDPSEGIKEVRYIDPRHIKKIRSVKKERSPKAPNVALQKVESEYYVYSPAGFMKKTGSYTGSVAGLPSDNVEGLKISKDSVVYCTSGFLDPTGKLILSYLHKAIRPLNMLRAMEDSLVIYRISRAPERRIFYVDVGGLPKLKAEQYLRDIMARFKNKIVYDSETGNIKDDRKFMTMLEDFWLPRREGGRGTEITTLPGGQNLGEIDDVVYFQNILYKSLNVPVTRLQPEAQFNLGRATEISRDEVKFSKFITRLRFKFADLFIKLLERQLVLKGVCTTEDWNEWKNEITFDFAVDNYFEELKATEILRERVNIAKEMDDYIGKYFSHKYIRKYIFKQSDDEIQAIDDQVKEEKTDPRYSEVDLQNEPQ